MRTVEEGPIAIPGGDRKVQWIDVRDLAKWIVEMIEGNKTGIFNAACQPVSYKDFSRKIYYFTTEILKKYSFLIIVILKNRIRCQHRLPFWVPISEQYPQGFIIVDSSKAIEAGLSIRPLGVTAHDTRKWAEHLDSEKCKVGPTKEIEKMLIEEAVEEVTK